MPYIKQERRDALAKDELPQNVGELNYVLTTLVLEYVEEQPQEKITYGLLDDILLILEKVKYQRLGLLEPMFIDGSLGYRLMDTCAEFTNRTGLATLGTLEAVKQEFYRRVVAAYEDLKIQENGDVYA